jgi:hypothetical protein
MKLNLNHNLIGLDGQEIAESNLGKLVANILASSNKGDAAKMWHWALKLHAGEELELDPSDLETLKVFIKDNEQLTVLSKAQIIASL